MPHLPDFEAWAIFAKVAEKGSFSQAAEDLGLAKTTVSKAISRLEERMRTTLLHRTTRKLSLTESGRLSLDRALRIMADGVAIEADILEEAAIPRGLIRVACSTGFGETALAPMLPAFMAAYPDIRLDITFSEQRVDIVAEGYDLAIQIGDNAEDSSLRISRLLTLRRRVTAAPSLIERHGRPRHPSDLAHYPMLIPSHVPWGREVDFTGPDGEHFHVPVSGALHMNSTLGLMHALLAGVGASAVPEYFTWEATRDGLLVDLFPDWTIPSSPICIVTPPGRARPARVRVLLEFLREQFSSLPWAEGIER
ncbi:LysR family transcriptional regulator [Sphingomonas histidinilytica]|jgi:DNA-binding transcriptional LysR family regulator|uniref:Transcriptional regulator, LysR family n=1 Tax=Rhizorhabdus histidinilytica TaxID=439228 RepID=A0A1T5D9H0_9SPHN|nr:LysR family transcriptional regulator [Rhizorhabdus histidinilytica]MBO9376984.1 LysR family transcriptional regulator [Rhizorhabdus histidinilytica]QEH80139.1 LysR family transcriptional regulator [Sphingomonas sp. C8-2]SKB68247.1 transcriptional regulator, LysR family [Rhizorhabdus histidinilytica]